MKLIRTLKSKHTCGIRKHKKHLPPPSKPANPFRLEALESRLLLSADPLGLAETVIEPEAQPEAPVTNNEDLGVQAAELNTVNEAPVVGAPGSALAVNEQTALAIQGTGFTVSDVDEADAGATARLSVSDAAGTLTVVVGDSGVTLDSGDGTGTVELSGTIAQLDALLTGAGSGTIVYQNTSDTPNATDTLTVMVNDLGNTGTDPGLTGNATSEEGTNNVLINLTAINDTPTVAAQPFQVTEGRSNGTSLGSIIANDPDGQPVTFEVTGGTGQNIFAVDANTGEITVADAAQLDFETTPNYTLDVTVSDTVNPALTSMAQMTINVVNAEVFNGAGDGTSWSDANNWDGGQIPTGSGLFTVVIPTGFTVRFDVPTTVEVNEFSLEAGSTLEFREDAVLTNLELRSLGATNIGGVIDTQGGNFFAEGAGVQFSSNQARIIASQGAQVTIAAPTYSSTGLTGGGILFSADGAGTVLDLSAVTSLDAGFNSAAFSGTQVQVVTATNGGQVNLSGVMTITAPVDPEDRVDFVLSDATSGIDLSGLQTIDNGTGVGLTRFELSNGATLDLPNVSVLQDVLFNLTMGAQLTATGLQPVNYSTTGIVGGTIISVDGVGTVLDLSAVTSLDAGFNGNTNSQVQTITATDGGEVKFYGLTEILAPVDAEDRLDVIGSGLNTIIELLSLNSITGNGQVNFDFFFGCRIADR